MDTEPERKSESTRMSFPRRVLRFVKRVVIGLFICLLLYAVVILIGLIPVNNKFQPASDGIEIFIISNPVHADVVLPVRTDVINWRDYFPRSCFAEDTGGATHVTIGWGDRGFFIHTPTWSDLRLSIASKALLWPSSACLHVGMTKVEYLPKDARSVRISREQYKKLVEFVSSTFQLDEGEARIQVPNTAYGPYDAFFEARGTYHCLNTCNSWVGRAMQASGIRTGLADSFTQDRVSLPPTDARITPRAP